MTRVALAILLVVAGAACSGDQEESRRGVEMTPGQVFEPKTITITVGESVTWENASTEHHTVTADEDSLPENAAFFASGGASSEDAADDDLSAGLIGPGESYSHTFDSPGTYRYYCIPHEEAGMAGTVVVQDP